MTAESADADSLGFKIHSKRFLIAVIFYFKRQCMHAHSKSEKLKILILTVSEINRKFQKFDHCAIRFYFIIDITKLSL